MHSKFSKRSPQAQALLVVRNAPVQTILIMRLIGIIKIWQTTRRHKQRAVSKPIMNAAKTIQQRKSAKGANKKLEEKGAAEKKNKIMPMKIFGNVRNLRIPKNANTCTKTRGKRKVMAH